MFTFSSPQLCWWEQVWPTGTSGGPTTGSPGPPTGASSTPRGPCATKGDSNHPLTFRPHSWCTTRGKRVTFEPAEAQGFLTYVFFGMPLRVFVVNVHWCTSWHLKYDYTALILKAFWDNKDSWTHVCPAATTSWFKSGQKWLEINQLCRTANSTKVFFSDIISFLHFSKSKRNFAIKTKLVILGPNKVGFLRF